MVARDVISVAWSLRAIRRPDRTGSTGRARDADASPRRAANRGTTRTGIARRPPRIRRARRVAPRVGSSSSPVRIHKVVPQWQCASIPPWVVSVSGALEAARLGTSTTDQLHAAMHAIGGLLASRRRVAVCRACHDGMRGIHRPAALGTVANGRIAAPVIEIGTGRAGAHADSHRFLARVNARDATYGIVTPVEQRIHVRVRRLSQSAHLAWAAPRAVTIVGVCSSEQRPTASRS
jgi:hypothetical protein